VEISSRYRALVALAILVSSLHDTWDSTLSRSGEDARRRSLRKDLGAHVYIDTAADDAAAVLQAYGWG